MRRRKSGCCLFMEKINRNGALAFILIYFAYFFIRSHVPRPEVRKRGALTLIQVIVQSLAPSLSPPPAADEPETIVDGFFLLLPPSPRECFPMPQRIAPFRTTLCPPRITFCRSTPPRRYLAFSLATRKGRVPEKCGRGISGVLGGSESE